MMRRILIPAVLALFPLLAHTVRAADSPAGNPARLYKPGNLTGTVGGCNKTFTDNLADATTAPTVHPALTRHSGTMCKMVIEIVPEKMYLALGYGLANMTLVVGESGLFLIDTLESDEATAEAYADLRAAAGTSAPLKGVLYSHSHTDHFSGIKALVSREDTRAGKVYVITQKNFVQNANGQNSFVDPIAGVRAAYAHGAPLIPVGAEGLVNGGLGPIRRAGIMSFVLPNKVIPDNGREEMTVAGINMLLQHVPGDTDDNVTVWFPDLQVLHHAAVVQGETFPALRSPGGTRYRDPLEWYRGVDRLRFQAKEARVLIGSHGRPVFGTPQLQDVLTAYRDAIQYVHDQTIRHMNRGLAPDAIVDAVSLPPHLAEHPWLGQFYGTVPGAVREIYAALLGSWQGDAASIARLPPVARAQGYVRMMGGRDAILGEARAAIDRDEYGWAADLLTWPIRVDADDMEARKLKATALRQIAYQQTSATERNVALVAALALEKALPAEDSETTWSLRNPDARGYTPIAKRLMEMSVRLKAEETRDVQLTMSMHVTGAWKAHALEIRRGIAEFHHGEPAHVDFTLTTKTGAPLDRILSGQTTLAEELEDNDTSLEGDLATAERFFGYFDVVDPSTPQPLVH
jgi:alkyl sulfatase BDS1-like metallo-beta-lactamase superfamily hydrolase